MKTKNFLLAALAAISLASCSSDGFFGSESSPDKMQKNAIGFGSGFKAITRANEHTGADAANLLNKHFTVSGFKVASTTTGDNPAVTTNTSKQVFYDYIVKWQANTAGTTESNSSDWEYVGYDVAEPSTLYKADPKVKQTIKYWDFSTDFYDFIAYSTGNATAVANKNLSEVNEGEVCVTPISYDDKATAAYTISGLRTDLADCFIADMVTVKKANYQKEVLLSFRSLASKVRMAIYETVPGYSVKDVKFYVDDVTSVATGASETEANLFATGSTDKDKFFTKGTFTVSYPVTGTANEGKSEYNVARTAFTPEENSPKTTQRFGKLEYTTAEGHEAVMDGSTEKKIWLGRTLNGASYAQDKDYTIMMPNEDGTVLELRIDYTLVSTDGSNEEIHIYGAKAFVPATYTKWLPNYAYTYIFKICDTTNGWTTNIIPEGGSEPVDPNGLYPITFDAVVIDTEDGKQSTITTVSSPCITTYQKGHNVSKDEYLASTGDIYVQVMQGGALVSDLKTEGKSTLFTLSGKENVTEADVMDALNIRKSETETVYTGLNGLVMTKAEISNNITTIPSADGNDITVTAGTAAKFTPSAGTYAYVYFVKEGTPKPIAETTYTNLNNDYAVKIIKVQ